MEKCIISGGFYRSQRVPLKLSCGGCREGAKLPRSAIGSFGWGRADVPWLHEFSDTPLCPYQSDNEKWLQVQRPEIWIIDVRGPIPYKIILGGGQWWAEGSCNTFEALGCALYTGWFTALWAGFVCRGKQGFTWWLQEYVSMSEAGDELW